jgi:hypothetical protein
MKTRRRMVEEELKEVEESENEFEKRTSRNLLRNWEILRKFVELRGSSLN